MNIEIRNFKQEDMPLLGDFYQKVTKDRKVVFWWIGPEENWKNVICAFENGEMVGKGQVEIINSIPDGHPKGSKHSIYLNLKTLPDRELDFELLNRLFQVLYDRALELKQHLSANYQTNFCVGNFGTEANNNRFFVDEKGFKPFETLYTMERDLQQPIEPIALSHPILKSEFWKMDSLEEEKQYLEAECEIWPDSALGLKRLREYKSNPSWTAIPVWENGSIIACAMAWQEDEMGVVEDVFVKVAWRKQGIAKFLLTTALTYLKDVGLNKAKLMVDTENEKALSVYKSVGFEVMEDERRFYMELV
ncbi:GNAT family N-acetyltransferase [Paucisalibacillus sp. EB02]|uniref:GNAT family N-acetyltransferase n=1 Tax=Paucisalibacillus sp. EB02 TaxID=1347087 RepID=UPI0005A81DFF|nr:GNAT family N-acetyltransferase [Paucisalibacillus sp. EB02]